MMDNLAGSIEMRDLLLPCSCKLPCHPEAKEASIHHTMPGERSQAHRANKRDEPWPELRPPELIGSNDIEEATDLIAAHGIHDDQGLD
jgi:hypothetical protein